MKKAVIALSIACAGALAFADTAQWQSPWITGIGTDASGITDLKPTNGTWNIPDDAATFDADAKTISFDLADDEEGKFTVTEAATEKTAQKITVTGVFTPCSATDLATGVKMNEDNAQIGFAVVSTGDTTTPYKYYAWIGKTDGATAEGGTAINDWVEVGACADATASTALTINFSYWGGTPKVSFSAKNGSSDAVTLAETALTSTAASSNKVSSIACTGSGTLSALSGDAGIAVATVNDTPYATVDDAIAAATDGQTVEINASPKDTVESDKTDTFDNTKECVVAKSGETTTVTVQPKASILETITINGVVLKKNTSALRTFLSKNCSAVYTGAESTAAKFQDALEKTPENKNGLALWQDYALGIEPDTKLAMGYATTDAETDGVKLALATAVSPSGDYTITYKCVQVGGTTTKESTDASAIKLPLTTGRYKVNVVFSAPAAEASGDDSAEQ